MQKDYKLAAWAGFLTGGCLIPTLWNIGYQNTGVLLVTPIISAVLIAFGVWLGRELSKWIPIMFQLGKFAAVGFLNTAINFAVINLFSLQSGVTSGISVGEYNIPATAIAATNSYFWNKHWVFGGNSQGAAKSVPTFIIVTILGLVVRSTMLVGITTYVPHTGIADGAWLNVANVLATFAGILVDFLGYKFIVFRK